MNIFCSPAARKANAAYEKASGSPRESQFRARYVAVQYGMTPAQRLILNSAAREHVSSVFRGSTVISSVRRRFGSLPAIDFHNVYFVEPVFFDAPTSKFIDALACYCMKAIELVSAGALLDEQQRFDSTGEIYACDETLGVYVVGTPFVDSDGEIARGIVVSTKPLNGLHLEMIFGD